jgi:RES domain-containing protein
LITAWRLTHARFRDQAMTGNGGLFAPGRWHTQGRRIIYSSSSLALATLELFVNLQDKRQLAEYVKTRLTIPKALLEALDQGTLARFQDADRFDSRSYGDAWLAEQRSCVLKVPSRVVLEESNYLLNPVHPAFEQIVHETTAYQVDARLWRE